jgi:hypothetical protein
VDRAPNAESESIQRLGLDAVVWVYAGIILLLGSILLTAVPISSTLDEGTTCGSMLRPTFDSPWETQSSCGIANLGALALVGTMFLTGCALIVLALRAGRRKSSLRPAQTLAIAVAITVVVATGVLTWRTETWPQSEPNGRRGWLSIRNAAAVVAVGLILLASAASAFTIRVRARHR